MCTCFWCCWVLLFQLQWMQNFCCRRRCCCCCLLQLLFTHRFSCIYIFLLILLSFRLFGLVDVQWWVHHFTNQRVDQFHQFRAVRQAVFDCHKSDGFRHRTSALIAHILLKWIMWMPMPVRLCCIYKENIEYIEYIYIDCLQPSVCNTIHQCVVCLHNNNWSSMMPIHTIVAKRYARRVRKIASNNNSNNNNIDWHICKTHKRALCETNVHCNYSKLNVSFMSRLSPHTSYFFTHCTMQKFCATAQRCTHTHTHTAHANAFTRQIHWHCHRALALTTHYSGVVYSRSQPASWTRMAQECGRIDSGRGNETATNTNTLFAFSSLWTPICILLLSATAAAAATARSMFVHCCGCAAWHIFVSSVFGFVCLDRVCWCAIVFFCFYIIFHSLLFFLPWTLDTSGNNDARMPFGIV